MVLPRSGPRRKLFLLLICVFSGAVAPSVGAQQSDSAQQPGRPAHRVLVIHSYSTDFQWTRDLDNAVRETFAGYDDGFTSVRSEFLDMKQHSSEDYFFALAQFLATKHAGRRFDLLIVADNLALEFLRRYRDAIFGPVPTVFTGINEYAPALTTGLSNVTGVAEDLSVHDTISFARDAMEGDTLFVFGDGTVTSQQNVISVERAIADLSITRDVRIFTGITIGELREVATEIDPDDIVVLVGSVLTDNGAVADFAYTGRVVAEMVAAPVFTLWDFFIGTGVAGGKLASGQEQGAAAAHLGMDILAGTNADAIPVQRESPNRWIFDAAVLDAAGVGTDQLPEGTVLVNAPPTIWNEYRQELVFALTIIVVLVVLISLLVINIRNRSLATHRLTESLREKDVLLKEIHHRVKNNLQVISSILNMQGTMITDPLAHSYFKDCETRVQSMALVHEQLYQTTTLTSIEMPPYINELVTTLLSAINVDLKAITVTQHVENVSMDLDHAIPIGLIINELLSNAFKYAYPGGSGAVEVMLARVGATCRLTIRDYGVGIDGTISAGESLGVQLVEALTTQLSGTVTFRNAEPGLEAIVEISACLAEFQP